MPRLDRNRARTAVAWLALALAVAASAPATAAPVPAASYSITLNNGAPITTPGSFSSAGELGEIQVLPVPLAFAHVSGQGRSLVALEYWFRVNGPAAGVPVPIQISGLVEIDAGGAVFQQNMVWGVSASLIAASFDGEIGAAPNPFDNQIASVSCNPNSVGPIPNPLPIPSCPATQQSQQVTLTLNTLSGADNRVNLTVTANNQESFGANFDALVDPVISFAPGFDSTGYSIELSPGLGNSVPEPTAAQLLASAAAVSLARRRRA